MKLRPLFVICWVGQGNRPRCGPRHPILHCNIFFYEKLFATITLSWHLLKRILWYLLKLSDPFFIKWKFSFANFNREKRWTINLLLSLGNEVFFLKKGNPIFLLHFHRDYRITVFNSCKKFKIFSFILFEKRRVTQ